MPGRAAGAATDRRGPRFTGTVWADPVLHDVDGMTMDVVTFEPGARSRWHHHEGGQLLIVTAGAGWIQVLGDAPQPLAPGDVVWIAPGERHWHGAASDTILTHLGVASGETTWLGEVGDDQYPAPHPTA